MNNFINRYINDYMNDSIINRHDNNNNINNDNNNNDNDSNNVTVKKRVLIMSGGSLKGIAQLGALSKLYEENLLNDIDTIAATSVGSLIGFLLIIGYRPNELLGFFERLDFSLTTDMSLSNIISNYGFDTGKNIMYVIKELCRNKKISRNITFQKLYDKYGIDFIVTGVCINDKTVYYFNKNSYPNMKVLSALRVSMSVPILFSPVRYKNLMFIDGGCMDNYPIHLFKDRLDEVIGIYISQIRKNVEHIDSIETFLKETIECLYEGVTMNYSKQFHTTNTIYIPCESHSPTEIDRETIDKFFNNGYECATEYVNNIDK